MQENLDKNVVVVGLGYVGLTLAVVLAELGFNVEGIEINSDILKLLKARKPHFFEPGLEERLNVVMSEKRFKVFDRFIISYTPKVYIITVGTPLNKKGQINLNMITKVTNEIAESMAEGSLIIGRSTVKIGTMDNLVKPILDSSKKGYDLAFCPERTLEGKALEELKYLPQIIGATNENSSLRASSLFQKVTSTVVKVSDMKTAEMIKLMDNVSRDVSFAFANEVALMCDEIGVNAYEVISSGKQGYPRTNLPLPGPVGGPCLSKDPYILLESLGQNFTQNSITKISRDTNELIPNYVINVIDKYFSTTQEIKDKKLNILLLGLAFKGRPETDDLRGSMVFPIIDSIKEMFPKSYIYAWDPIVKVEKVGSLGLKAVDMFEDSFRDKDLVLILNNHPFFQNILLKKETNKMRKNGLVYDLWNHFSNESYEMSNNVIYMGLGSKIIGENQ